MMDKKEEQKLNKIAKFSKISCKEFAKNLYGYTDEEVRSLYDNIRLPDRATKGSAGYDFYAPFSFVLQPGQSVKVPTGIRVEIEEGWVLQVYPRSGLGFKYRLQLDNTVGIIDSDYFHADNEGHIFIKMSNDSKKGDVVGIEKGERFAQGIFLPFGITVDDEAFEERTGGFGSTGK